jgi:hypothetical protein
VQQSAITRWRCCQSEFTIGWWTPVGTGGAEWGFGGLVDAFLATVADFAAQTSLTEVLAVTASALLLIALASLFVAHLRLKKRFAKAEAELFERTVGKQSTNWAATALNLERKAKDPGLVARSSAMTHLHMLDEAANAWLKGSQWQEALRVTQEFLRECCHTIGRPSIHEDDFRAAADLIERRLATYPDLSKAVNEAPENALRFLTGLDKTLSVFVHDPRIEELRTHVGEASAAIEKKPEGKQTLAHALARKLKPDSTSDTPKALSNSVGSAAESK